LWGRGAGLTARSESSDQGSGGRSAGGGRAGDAGGQGGGGGAGRDFRPVEGEKQGGWDTLADGGSGSTQSVSSQLRADGGAKDFRQASGDEEE